MPSCFRRVLLPTALAGLALIVLSCGQDRSHTPSDFQKGFGETKSAKTAMILHCLSHPLDCWDDGVNQLHEHYSRGSGWVRIPWGDTVGVAYNAILESDGKIVVAGETYPNPRIATITRYLTDGSLDRSFGKDGVMNEETYRSDYFYGVGVQTDGKYVGVGAKSNDFIVARFLSNGALDTSFNTAGLITSGSKAFLRVEFQTDGNILAFGGMDTNNSYGVVIRRYLTDGRVDTTFSSDGDASANVYSGGSSTEYAYGFGFTTNGKMVVVANAGGEYGFGLASFNVDGSLDTSFNTDGIVSTTYAAISGGSFYSKGLSIQTDGKIVALGDSGWALGRNIALQRFLSGGVADTSFGTNSWLITPPTSGSLYYYGHGIGVKADGVITATGYAYSGATGSDMFIAFVDSGGTLTNSYFIDNGQTERAFGSILQTDGKILLLGDVGLSGTGRFAVVRFGTSALDTSFKTTGFSLERVNPGSAAVNALAIQTDGRMVVAGHFTDGSVDQVAIARLTPAGLLDTSFNTGGTKSNFMSGITGHNRFTDIAIATDGKIALGGFFTSGGGKIQLIGRINTDGTLDTTFNSSGLEHTYKNSLGAASGPSIALQTDSKLLFGSANFVHRYLSSGNFDTSFYTYGIAQSNMNGNRKVLVQTDGQIIVAGGGWSNDFAITRLNSSNGNQDATFSGGSASTNFYSGNDEAYSVKQQSGGEILAIGVASSNGNDFAFVRYLSSGLLDTTFASSGKTAISLGSGSDVAYAGALSNGKIIAAGMATSGASMAVMRLTSSGLLDTTFRSTGKLLFSLSSGSNELNALTVLQDGSLLLGGYRLNGTQNRDAIVIRIAP